MLFALLLAFVALCLLIFGIVIGFVDRSRPYVNREENKQSEAQRRQTEILERNRMEDYSRREFFGGSKK